MRLYSSLARNLCLLSWFFFHLPVFALTHPAITVNITQTLTWGSTNQGLVLIKGEWIKSLDLRVAGWTGLFGNDRTFDLGTFTEHKDRCELHDAIYFKEGKAIPYDGKQIAFGPSSNWFMAAGGIVPLGSNEKDFDQKGLFRGTGFEVIPNLDHNPTEIYFNIRCKGNESLGKMISIHLGKYATVDEN